MTLQELIAEHIALADYATQRERAMLEHELWVKVVSSGWNGPLSGEKWFAANIPGVAQRDFRVRSMLLSIGDGVEEFWRRLDEKKMTTSSIASMIMKARIKALSTNRQVADVLNEALKEYDQLPYIRMSRSGVPYRIAGQKHLTRKRRSPRKSPEKLATESAIFWADIKARTEKFLKKELAYSDPVVHTTLERELLVMLRIVARDFRDSLAKAMETDEHVAKMDKQESVSKDEVEKACSTLGMDPPPNGKPADLHLAKRNKWRLANEYHPDKTHGDTSELFESVMHSYLTLERYNSQLQKGG